MKLVIVESPNKIRKIRGYLGPDYNIAASFGHVRDLPAKGDLAVAFEDGRIIPTYVMLERSSNCIRELKELAKKADEILLAMDPDREGEAIAWHVSALLGEHKYSRVVFHSITKKEVQEAVAKPRPLAQHLVDAQQARRVLDRVVGWLVSPTLRSVGKEARSAGRVQSVALRLVARREQEINRHNNVEYYSLSAKLEKPGSPPSFTAELVAWKGEPLAHRLRDQELADQTVAWLKNQEWKVLSCQRKDANRNAPPPFTTATVQQAASVKLAMNPDQTMKLLQGLFEEGKITYHRTDSSALAPEAVEMARRIIAKKFPPDYLPEKGIVHASKAANAQEAHEAIRPTDPETGPGAAGDASGKLYKLIWQRFVACQMAPGRDQITTIDVAVAPAEWEHAEKGKVPRGVFQAKGKVVLFDGWRKLVGGDATQEKKKKDDEEEADVELPMLEVGDELKLLAAAAKKKKTKPPARYTQASLIKKLETDGIGRPSTYANIMKTIMARGYVKDVKRKLHCTPLGMDVTRFLVVHYSGNFIELDYTARLEEELDRISRGEAQWEQVVTEASFAVLKLAKQAGLWRNPLKPRAKPEEAAK
ncbi:MAG: type I DNA topoisomerase [Elusimicrobiota bacterium]